MTWFKREDNEIVNDPEKTVRTEGLWARCPSCKQIVFKADIEANLEVCPKCGHHYRMDARARIDNLLEPGYQLVDLELRSTDPLEFTDLKPYKKRLAEAQKKTGLNDAIINAVGNLGPHPVVVSAMEYAFIGGSMGAVVGETIARAVDRSLSTRHTRAGASSPLIATSPIASSSNRFSIASLTELETSVSPGAARACNRAARFTGLPTTPYAALRVLPVLLAITVPAAMPM